MSFFQLKNKDMIISDIRFNEVKKEVYAKFDDLVNKSYSLDLPENSKLKKDLLNEIKFKKALFIKISSIVFYSDHLLPESKSTPVVNYNLPFSEYPNIVFENDIIKNFFENICITFRSSLDILTHLLSIQIKFLPSLPTDPNGEYHGFKRGKNKNTLKILEKYVPALYSIFHKNINWINQLCDYRDIIIHKKGYLDISYWTKIQEKQSITWVAPTLDNGESIELFTIKIRDKIINFYKEILTEYDNLNPQPNTST